MRSFVKLFTVAFMLIALLTGFAMGEITINNWTGDSGIDLYQESTTVQEGTYSCKVSVNTGDQASCDMRHDEVSVTAGNSYLYSFYIQSSANVKARVVLEWTGASITYSGYSDISTSSFTEVTASGTVPTGATGVKVGLRFYDQSGFSSPEIQYVDNFTFESPTSTPITLSNGDMESWSGGVNPEPTNHVSSFAAAIVTDEMVKVTWTDNQDAGDPADGFLLEGYPTALGSSYSPTDGDDSPSSANSVFAWVETGVEKYTFTELTAETEYTVKIWPYSNSGTAIDYKSDGVIPSVTGTTDETHTTIGSETFAADLGVMTAVSVAGTNTWGYASGVAQVNGYGGDNPEEDWLISPPINFDNFSDEIMYFETAYNYGVQDANNYLKLYYTTSYSTPGASSWTELPFEYASSSNTIESSGLIDISGISGTAVVFGYKYYSTDNPRRWDVDNINITGVSLVAAAAPEATTGSASDVTYNSAILHGQVDPNLADATVTFEYGETVSYGSSVTANQSPVSGDGEQDVTASLTNLDPEVTYHFRIKAVNSEGTAYGDDATFTTVAAPEIPALLISEVTDPGDVYQTRFVELYNNSGSTIDFSSETWYLCRQTNGGSTWEDKLLTGTLAHGDVYISANSNENESDYFYVNFGFMADFDYGGSSGNGDDGYFLYYGGDHTTGTLVDAFGVIDIDGTGEGWEYEDSRAVRKGVTEGNPTWTASEWEITPADVADCTPGTLAGDYPLPIALASFTATAVNGTVELAWETATETNNARFVIYRNNEAIGSVEGAGTTSEPHNYIFVDETVVPGVTYTYVLADVDYANTETKYTDDAVTVTVANNIVEADFVVGDAYPNPFNPSAVLPVELNRNAMLKASLYDLNGREVQSLANGNYSAGSYDLRINGANLTTGLYLVRVLVDNTLDIQKIALIK